MDHELLEEIDALTESDLKVVLGYVKGRLDDVDPNYNPDKGYWKK